MTTTQAPRQLRQRRLGSAKKHYDDCGDSLKSIELADEFDGWTECSTIDDRGDLLDLELLTDAEERSLAEIRATSHFLYRSAEIQEHSAMMSDCDASSTHYTSVEAMMVNWMAARNDFFFVDVVELCGGSSHVMQMMVRRHELPVSA